MLPSQGGATPPATGSTKASARRTAGLRRGSCSASVAEAVPTAKERYSASLFRIAQREQSPGTVRVRPFVGEDLGGSCCGSQPGAAERGVLARLGAWALIRQAPHRGEQLDLR